MPPLRRLDTAGDAVRQVIRAYHGSPYDFDRFDASMIGAGEGHQSFGHGLYFAGNEKVADTYRTMLSGRYQDMSPSVEDIEKYFTPGNIVEGYGGKDKVLKFLPNKDEPWNWRVHVISVDDAGNPLPHERPRAHHTIPDMDKVDRFFGRPPRRPGHSYEVEIGYPEQHLLDLDSPVDSQSPEVLAALGEYATAPSHFTFGQKGWRGKNAYMRAADRLGSPAEASQFLLERGVPGSRYFDQGSRTTADGTRNYVIFPGAEDQIRILRKYGLMAPVAASAMDDGENR